MRRIDLTSIVTLAIVLTMTSCEDYPQGQRVYETYCMNCHMQDGSGLEKLIPPLYGIAYDTIDLETAACSIKYGIDPTDKPGGRFNPMPSHTNLSDTDISNLLNYINSSWGNTAKPTSPAEIREMLEGCPQSVR